MTPQYALADLEFLLAEIGPNINGVRCEACGYTLTKEQIDAAKSPTPPRAVLPRHAEWCPILVLRAFVEAHAGKEDVQ